MPITWLSKIPLSTTKDLMPGPMIGLCMLHVMYSNSNMHSLLIGFPSFLRERRDLHSLLIGFPSFSAKEGILKSQSLFLEKDEHLDIASLNR